MEISKKIIDHSLWGLKCPHSMEPSYITIHNTANNASAAQEVAYLKKNTASTSCHIFVDENEVIQCLPLDRNAWHAGDGSNGTGNRNSIGVEICRSTDYKTDRHHQAMLNATEIVRQLMNEYKIPLDHVVQHNHWSGKDCPHRIREEGMWETFLSLCEEKNQEEEKLEIREGKQTVQFRGKNYTVVKQAKDENVSIWSLKHPALAKLSAFRSAGEKPAFAKNLSFFVMEGADRGQVCGSEISDIYDEAVPTEQGYIDVIKFKDGSWKFGNFGPHKFRSDEVDLRYSTGMVLVAGGTYSNEYSVPDGESIRSKSTIMSCLFVDWSNVAYMVVSEESVTPDEMRDFALSLDMQYAFRDDSGGSSEIVENGVVIAGAKNGERALPNCLVFTKKKTSPEPAPAPSGERFIVVDSVGMRVRESLAFSAGRPTGKQLKLVPVGGKAKLIRFIPGIQADGYQWAETEYNGIVGFSQYDSQCYWIEEDGD